MCGNLSISKRVIASRFCFDFKSVFVIIVHHYFYPSKLKKKKKKHEILNLNNLQPQQRPIADTMILHGVKERGGGGKPSCDPVRFGGQLFNTASGGTDFAKAERVQNFYKKQRSRRSRRFLKETYSGGITAHGKRNKRRRNSTVAENNVNPEKSYVSFLLQDTNTTTSITNGSGSLTKVLSDLGGRKTLEKDEEEDLNGDGESNNGLRDLFGECKGIPHDMEKDWFDMYDVHDYFLNQPNIDFIQWKYVTLIPKDTIESKEKHSKSDNDVDRSSVGGEKSVNQQQQEEEDVYFISPPTTPLFGYNKSNHWKIRQKHNNAWAPFTPAHCMKKR